MLRSMILATATLVLAAQTPAPEATQPEAAAAAAPSAAVPKPAEAAQPAEATESAPSAEAAEAPQPVKAAKAPKGARPAKPADPVLAWIGKQAIRQSDFELFLDTALTQQQRMQAQFVEGARSKYLEQYLQYCSLAAKARKEGLQKQPDHAKKLAIMDMQLLIQALMERDGSALQAKAAVKDEDVKAYFTAHPDKFTTPETFTVRHILISTRANGDQKAPTDAEAKAKVDKVLAEIKGGKSFADAAKEYSDDPGSKDKGGLYEDTPFGRFVPEFDQAVRTQPIGQVGTPVKTMFGYHLIEVEKITPAAAQTFDQAKDEAREQVSNERQEAIMEEYMDKAKKEVGFRAAPAPGAAKSATRTKKAAQ
jgi:parvulin-like peptidyl-prolyl isomerase